MSEARWRIRSLEELAARRVIGCLCCGEGTFEHYAVASSLCYAPATVLEALWSHASETDRLCDVVVEAICGGDVQSLELGRVPLGLTERGLRRGCASFPSTIQTVRVGWPSHFGGKSASWITSAIHSAAQPPRLKRIELKAAGFGGAQGGLVPAEWSFNGQQATTNEEPPCSSTQKRSGRRGGVVKSASLVGVGDGEIKSLLRATAGDHLTALCVAGAREAEGRFADVLAQCAPKLAELSFRDAPLVADDACAALVTAVASTLTSLDFAGTLLGRGGMRALAFKTTTLRTLNIDRAAEVEDEDFEQLCRQCSNLQELSAQSCPKLGAARVWTAVANLQQLVRLRCDLKKHAADDAPGNQDDDLAQSLSESLLSYSMEERRDLELSMRHSLMHSAQQEAALIAEFPPFDAKFAGTALRSLRVTFVDVSNDKAWLDALLEALPPSLTELQVRAASSSDVTSSSETSLVELGEPSRERTLCPADAGDLERLLEAKCPDLDSLALSTTPDLFSSTAFARLTSLNASCRLFGAEELSLLVNTPQSKLRYLCLASDGRGSNNEQDDVITLKNPHLESIRLEGVNLRGREVALEKCRSLDRVYLKRCSLAKMTAAGSLAAPRLRELSLVECRDLHRDASANAPRDFAALRRLRAPSDAFAANFITSSSNATTGSKRSVLARLRSLTLDETYYSPSTPSNIEAVSETTTTSFGLALLARAACAAAYLGNTPVVDGLLALELICARELTPRHVAALPLACPALRRLRLVACRGLRGPLASATPHPSLLLSDDATSNHYEDAATTPVRGRRMAANNGEDDDGDDHSEEHEEEAFNVEASDDDEEEEHEEAADTIFDLEEEGENEEGALRSVSEAPSAASVRFAADTTAPSSSSSTRHRAPPLEQLASAAPSSSSQRRRRRQQQQEEEVDIVGMARTTPKSSSRRRERSNSGSNNSLRLFGEDEEGEERKMSEESPAGTSSGSNNNPASFKQRFDSFLQCHVGCNRHERGPVAELMRALSDRGSAEYREHAKLAALLPREKGTARSPSKARAACARHLMGACRRGVDCEYSHGKTSKLKGGEKKLRRYLETLADVDTFVDAISRDSTAAAAADITEGGPSSWPPPPPPPGRQRRSRAQSEEDLLLFAEAAETPPSSHAGSYEGSPGNGGFFESIMGGESDDGVSPMEAATGFLKKQQQGPLHALCFPRLEAFEMEACEGVRSLKLHAPRLLALCTPRCDRLISLEVTSAPKCVHLDLRKCPQLSDVPLVDASLKNLRVASLAGCASLGEPFLHRFVDHCRFLTHLDIHGVETTTSGTASSGSNSNKKKNRGSDPYRVRVKSKAGIEKLKSGRPDLEVIRTKKEHDAPNNAMRTTLDLTLG